MIQRHVTTTGDNGGVVSPCCQKMGTTCVLPAVRNVVVETRNAVSNGVDRQKQR